MILIHGYVPGNIIPLDVTMAEAIMSTNTANVYNMDYTFFANTLNYPQAVVNAKKIGQLLGKSLSLMKDSKQFFLFNLQILKFPIIKWLLCQRE